MEQTLTFNETDIRKALIYYTRNVLVKKPENKIDWEETRVELNLGTKDAGNFTANVKLEIVGI